VLDVGCGTGDFLRLLAPTVSPGKAIGLDLSETMIAEAVKRSEVNLNNISFRMGSVGPSFSSGTFVAFLQRNCSSRPRS
jgi:ubiquinone/menaquinone biosynthesis C-methylase UbiE